MERVDRYGSEGEEYGRRCEVFVCVVFKADNRQALCLYRGCPLTEDIMRGSDRAAADPFDAIVTQGIEGIASATRLS